MILDRRAIAGTAALLFLAGCDGGPGGATGPGAVSEGEAASLDDAAEMLEERRLPEGALPPLDATPEEGAEEQVE